MKVTKQTQTVILLLMGFKHNTVKDLENKTVDGRVKPNQVFDDLEMFYDLPIV
jgi:rRNA pseudouridine-1189 N-methylase Emg1 (Nep1/Mra1 family)